MNALRLFILLGCCVSTSLSVVDRYKYDNQDCWPEIEFQYAENHCGDSGESSPINIPSRKCFSNMTGVSYYPGDTTLGCMQFRVSEYGTTAFFVQNVGCEIPTLSIPEKENKLFVAKKIDVKIGCEHKIDGQSCDAEMQLIFTSKDSTEHAAISIMMENDARSQNSSFDALLNCWKKAQNTFAFLCLDKAAECEYEIPHKHRYEDPVCSSDSLFDITNFIQEDSGYYYYYGGQTVPPCAQKVHWNVVDKKVSISLKQWTHLSSLILNYAGYVADEHGCVYDESAASSNGSTTRHVQDIGKRNIYHKCNFAS